MPQATPTGDVAADGSTEQRVAIRIPAGLWAELRQLAHRDANGTSAAARRLLAAGVAPELRSVMGGQQ